MDDDAEREAWAVLASVDGVGPATFARLIEAFGSARAVIDAAGTRSEGAAAIAHHRDPLTGRALVSDAVASAIVEASAARGSLLDSFQAAGVQIVTPHHASYPRRLRAIDLPPPVLFVRGRVDALDPGAAVAVVGTRRPTEAGRRVAGRIVSALAGVGAGIVSGLALGIDGVAHAAALAVHAPNVAVIAGGHLRLYPGGHRALADRIVADGGGVVSEHPPHLPPSRGTFPRRNRIISGMADATVVVEAGVRSGALTTAAWALEQGRPLFLTPGAIDVPQVAGSLAFLRAFSAEARIVAGVRELLEDLAGLGVLRPGAGTDRVWTPGGADAVLAELGRAERSVVGALARGAGSLDELVAATDLAPAALLGTLTVLEVRGIVAATFGRYRLVGRLASLGPGGSGEAATRVRRAVRAGVQDGARDAA